MKKLRFLSHPRAKVRCQRPLGSARSSTALSEDVHKPINTGTVLILLSFGCKRSWYNYAVMGNNNIPFSSSLLILRTSRFHTFIPRGSEILKKWEKVTVKSFLLEWTSWLVCHTKTGTEENLNNIKTKFCHITHWLTCKVCPQSLEPFSYGIYQQRWMLLKIFCSLKCHCL